MAVLLDRLDDLDELVPREEWDSSPKNPPANRSLFEVIGQEHHHTVTATGPILSVLNQIRSFHTRSKLLGGKGWTDIFYHFLIDLVTGMIYEGRRLDRTSQSDLSSWVTVAWVGDLTKMPLSAPGAASAYRLESIFNLPPVLRGHRQRPAQTACPGDPGIAYVEARQAGWVPDTLTPGGTDMLFRLKAGFAALDWLVTGALISAVSIETSDAFAAQGMPRHSVDFGTCEGLRDRWKRAGILDETTANETWMKLAAAADLEEPGRRWRPSNVVRLTTEDIDRIAASTSLTDKDLSRIANAVNLDASQRLKSRST